LQAEIYDTIDGNEEETKLVTRFFESERKMKISLDFCISDCLDSPRLDVALSMAEVEIVLFDEWPLI
jgi:hypothetical protein